MRRRISIRGCPSVGPSVDRSICPVLFLKVKSTHTRRILCRVSDLVYTNYIWFYDAKMFPDDLTLLALTRSASQKQKTTVSNTVSVLMLRKQKRRSLAKTKLLQKFLLSCWITSQFNLHQSGSILAALLSVIEAYRFWLKMTCPLFAA